MRSHETHIHDKISVEACVAVNPCVVNAIVEAAASKELLVNESRTRSIRKFNPGTLQSDEEVIAVPPALLDLAARSGQRMNREGGDP